MERSRHFRIRQGIEVSPPLPTGCRLPLSPCSRLGPLPGSDCPVKPLNTLVLSLSCRGVLTSNTYSPLPTCPWRRVQSHLVSDGFVPMICTGQWNRSEGQGGSRSSGIFRGQWKCLVSLLSSSLWQDLSILILELLHQSKLLKESHV